MNADYFQRYIHNFPLTFGVVIINTIIFLLTISGTITPIVSTPGIINLHGVLANFSHYDLMHFAFNMLILWQISPLIEVKFRGTFYATIIIGLTTLTTLGVARLSAYPTLGFSGIGLGLMVFAGMMYWKNPQISRQLLGWAGANIVLGLMPGISFAGHFVGALAGLLIFGIIYILAPQMTKP